MGSLERSWNGAIKQSNLHIFQMKAKLSSGRLQPSPRHSCHFNSLSQNRCGRRFSGYPNAQSFLYPRARRFFLAILPTFPAFVLKA
jgi:hypothetical protein